MKPRSCCSTICEIAVWRVIDELEALGFEVDEVNVHYFDEGVNGFAVLAADEGIELLLDPSQGLIFALQALS